MVLLVTDLSLLTDIFIWDYSIFPSEPVDTKLRLEHTCFFIVEILCILKG